MLAIATISKLSPTVTPSMDGAGQDQVASTMKPELTILLAAMVRAVSDLGTVVVRNA